MAVDPAEPSGPPPVLSGRPWPDVERLVDGAAVLARPDPVYAPDAFRLAADPALWVDVPTAGRTRSVVQQRDDLEEFAAHWDRHGFGYWLVWADRPGGELLGLGGLRWLWWRGDWVLNLYVRLARRAQGRGLARRTLSTALDRLDADLVRPTTAVVRTQPTNTAMVGLARRLGFVEAGDEERELGTYRILQRTVGGRREDKVMTAAESSDDRPRIRLRDRGPAVVPLDLPVVRTTADWATRSLAVPDDPRGNVALCRCGQSGNKPFCDASHRGPDVEVEPDEAADVPDAAMADRPSGLGPCLALEDDGPVRLCGGIVVALPDGRVVEVADGTGLCRCGQSTTRPWCDGSHRTCSFTESG